MAVASPRHRFSLPHSTRAHSGSARRRLATARVVVDGAGGVVGAHVGNDACRTTKGDQMNSNFTALDASLNRAEFRWKWLRCLKYSSILGILLCLVLGLFGAAILSGQITSRSLAVAI